MNFSDELNKYLNLLHCSPGEFSKISNLSPTIVSRYLNNKRTPRANSKYFNQTVESLYTIANEKKIELDKTIIFQTLKESLNAYNIDYDAFINNFNSLQNRLQISNVNLADALCYDPSFISKIKSKSRKPANLDNFINKLCDYIVSNYNNEEKKCLIVSITNCNKYSLNNKQAYKSEIFKWFTTSHEGIN